LNWDLVAKWLLEFDLGRLLAAYTDCISRACSKPVILQTQIIFQIPAPTKAALGTTAHHAHVNECTGCINALMYKTCPEDANKSLLMGHQSKKPYIFDLLDESLDTSQLAH